MNTVFSKCVSALNMCMLVLLFVACEESIDINSKSNSYYDTDKEQVAGLIDEQNINGETQEEFWEKGSTKLYFKVSKGMSQECRMQVEYNTQALDTYNAGHGTKLKAFPRNLVTLAEDGQIVLFAGTKRSEAIEVFYKTDENLELSETYVIPLSVNVISGELKLKEGETDFFIFVKDMTKSSQVDKDSGIKIFSIMEVNDANPLSHLCFKLKRQNKYLVDAVVLFSANINYDANRKKVYLHQNENIQTLLSQREKYLKPLQDKGMKVILSILGNHDCAGLGNLSDNTAREFAQELKELCDTYNLDGVMFDDEYSYYYEADLSSGIFVRQSNRAAARLCYEVKRAMPDKLVTIYVYGFMKNFENITIDGHSAGDFVDYAWHDYGGAYDLQSCYPGVPQAHLGYYSYKLIYSDTPPVENLIKLREMGSRIHMIYALDPFHVQDGISTLQYQIEKMENIAEYLFDDELVYDGNPYRKDW